MSRIFLNDPIELKSMPFRCSNGESTNPHLLASDRRIGRLAIRTVSQTARRYDWRFDRFKPVATFTPSSRKLSDNLFGAGGNPLDCCRSQNLCVHQESGSV